MRRGRASATGGRRWTVYAGERDTQGEARAVATASRLIDALCDVPLPRWRAAARVAIADPRLSLAATALEAALASVDRICWWEMRDDLETALFRLTSDEACAFGLGRREREGIRAATQRAMYAVLCDGRLSAAHFEALARPLLDLVSPTNGAREAPAVAPRAGAYLRPGRSLRDPIPLELPSHPP